VLAGNGRETVTAFEKESFDLVLMDLQMPEMDGFEGTAAIREKEKVTGSHLPMVALTAQAMKAAARNVWRGEWMDTLPNRSGLRNSMTCWRFTWISGGKRLKNPKGYSAKRLSSGAAGLRRECNGFCGRVSSFAEGGAVIEIPLTCVRER
jgi:CheY-like chemotaxis protein